MSKTQQLCVGVGLCACVLMTNVSAAMHPFAFQLTRSILTVSGEWVELTRLNNIQVMEAAVCLPPATQEGHKRVSINTICLLNWTKQRMSDLYKH